MAARLELPARRALGARPTVEDEAALRRDHDRDGRRPDRARASRLRPHDERVGDVRIAVEDDVLDDAGRASGDLESLATAEPVAQHRARPVEACGVADAYRHLHLRVGFPRSGAAYQQLAGAKRI
jgi:hypothetical protein